MILKANLLPSGVLVAFSSTMRLLRSSMACRSLGAVDGFSVCERIKREFLSMRRFKPTRLTFSSSQEVEGLARNSNCLVRPSGSLKSVFTSPPFLFSLRQTGNFVYRYIFYGIFYAFI